MNSQFPTFPKIPPTAKPVGTVPAGPRPTLPNPTGTGTLPLPIARPVYTDSTQSELSLLGWKPGDPIPPQFADQIATLRQQYLKEQEQFDIMTDPRVAGKRPQITSRPISELPAEAQDQLRQTLSQFKEEQTAQQAFDTARAAADATIGSHIQGADREAMLQQIMAGDTAEQAAKWHESQAAPIVIDDRRPSTATAAADIPTAGATEIKLHHCPRCTWPLDRPFEVTPTDQDKQTFLAAVLSVGRFTKLYALMGGNLQVTFRSLTVPETEAIQNKIRERVRSGEIVGDPEYFTVQQAYRLALSVQRVTVGQLQVYAAPPTTASIDIEACQAAFLASIKTEIMGIMISNSHKQFQRLVELLETMVADPDFWNGIGLPA